ncbi:hypothetical protein DAPPUDRAFT_243586 [Daphnia pulex]|uniref:Uncharacterized protein n=1 Tax=Daphnia pulex TaxID=6669 RepID=E9GJ62_DAPPU|nr:hypothetical protein DAPPUDRAFT_243586 [Daphnia pulex]|eukprot:EFX80541.1 hypothetical protein DAPPUDRAFT_243586 [Daphnia pulex]
METNTPVSSSSSQWGTETNWKKVYSTKAINAALEKVRMVGFNERIVVAFRNADLLFLTALTPTTVANPDSMLGEFCMAVDN